MLHKQGFGTLVIDSGSPDIVPKVHRAKASPWKSLDEKPTHTYSRSSPDETVQALETKISRLHEGAEAITFFSGQACTADLLSTLKPGEHVICSEQIYGTTRNFIEQELSKYATYTFISPTYENLEAAVRPETRYLLIETPTNPLLTIVDLDAIQKFSEKYNVDWIFDNTFATMFLIDGFKYNAKAVYYSASKYISGHHDVIGGFIVTKDKELADQLRALRRMYGNGMSPDVAYRINVEMQTFKLRMRAHCDNAAIVAEYLDRHLQVSKAYYPGLKNHQGHEIAAKQMRAIDNKPGFGGIVSFEVKGDYEEFARAIAAQEGIIHLSESLGSGATLLSNPAKMSHVSVPPEKQLELGIKPNLFRLSVGIGDVDDIIYSLEKGFNHIK